jgi:hypothetical protein
MTRNEKINRLRNNHRLQEIAALYGLSRQRVAMIVMRQPEPPMPKGCELCGDKAKKRNPGAFMICDKCWAEIQIEKTQKEDPSQFYKRNQ